MVQSAVESKSERHSDTMKDGEKIKRERERERERERGRW